MRSPKVVRQWRIQLAEPRGCTMWFDPECEVPMLGSLPRDGVKVDGWYEGGALRDEGPGEQLQLEGTTREEGGVPCEGDAATKGNEEEDDLPF